MPQWAGKVQWRLQATINPVVGVITQNLKKKHVLFPKYLPTIMLFPKMQLKTVFYS